jgi:hypothetical protein
LLRLWLLRLVVVGMGARKRVSCGVGAPKTQLTAHSSGHRRQCAENECLLFLDKQFLLLAFRADAFRQRSNTDSAR